MGRGNGAAAQMFRVVGYGRQGWHFLAPAELDVRFVRRSREVPGMGLLLGLAYRL